MTTSSQPLPIGPAPDPVDRELEPLLQEPFASACADAVSGADASPPRGRLLSRVARSGAASRTMFTARRARLGAVELAPGVHVRTLYTAGADRTPRPGEPLQVRLVEMQPGSHWVEPATANLREWLVIDGEVQLGDDRLGLRDYQVAPGGSAACTVHSVAGAMLFIREAVLPAAAGSSTLIVHDEQAGWPEYAPGIRRRVLWQFAGQAAMLYHAEPGAAVPLHNHGHDEECLMVQGELFLDDVLLRTGDYQLAPAGTSHTVTETDTGVVIYAHGDLDLQFVG